LQDRQGDNGCSQKAVGKVVARWLSGSSDSGCVMPVFPWRFFGGVWRQSRSEKERENGDHPHFPQKPCRLASVRQYPLQ